MNHFWLEETARAAAVGIAFLLIFAAAEIWKRRGNPSPEMTRKFVHLGGGIVCLSLPWVVRSHWTVLVLGLAFAGIILMTRRMGLLGSVHDVERRSEGGLYFPVAVYLLFLLAADRPVFYLIALLALVVSDALAALIGTSYGRLTFQVETDRKSLEGSAVFLFSTFLAAHLPLLLMTEMGEAASVLIAVQLALLVTTFEAISLRGNDNLIVPLGTYLLLEKMTPKSAEFIGLQLLVQLLILLLLLILVWRVRVLTLSGTLGASLFFYGAFSLAGPAWLVAPALAVLAMYVLLRRARGTTQSPNPRYQLLATFYTTLVPSAIFLIHNLLYVTLADPWPPATQALYPLYLGALAAHLAILARVFPEPAPWLRSIHPWRTGSSWLIALLAVFPAGIWAGPDSLPAWQFGVATLVPALALLSYEGACRLPTTPCAAHADVRLQALVVGVVSLVAGVALLLPALLDSL